MKTTVLMLGHKARAGKDTVAGFLYNYGFVRSAFADKLKETVKDLYQLSEDQVWGNSKDSEDTRYKKDSGGWNPLLIDNSSYIYCSIDKYYTPREILQKFGQEQRVRYPDIWANYVFYETIPKLKHSGLIVITDFRFRNELSVAKRWEEQDPSNRRVVTVKINRPGVLALSGSNDISEIDLEGFKFDFEIINDGSLNELEEKSIRTVDFILDE